MSLLLRYQIRQLAIANNSPVFSRQLAEHFYGRVQELKPWGFFDSPLSRTSFIKLVQERNIPLVKHVTVTHLLKEKGRRVGASGFSLKEKNPF
jgi:hypothetical protein